MAWTSPGTAPGTVAQSRMHPERAQPEPWRDNATKAIESSSTLRSVIRDLPTAWPGMMPFVAAYDASQRVRSLDADDADAPGRP